MHCSNLTVEDDHSNRTSRSGPRFRQSNQYNRYLLAEGHRERRAPAMMSFMPDELVWAMQREREREARNVLPHTETTPDAERSTLEQERNPVGVWIGSTLRPGSCR